jgi:hypothetical protein
MPLIPGKGHVGENIKEFRTGKTYAHTEGKFGKQDADKQALAVALHTQDKAEGKSEDHQMAQEYGAAQPIVDAVKGPINKVKKFFGGGDDEQDAQPAQTEQHVDPKDVAAANASFAKPATDPAAAKAAVAKMHPQHVHQLVQDAHSGKFGPDAQKAAKQAMQSPTGAPDGKTDQPGPTAKPNYADMFSTKGKANEDPDQAVSAGQMFSGR